jgi:hypothetical protein
MLVTMLFLLIVLLPVAGLARPADPLHVEFNVEKYSKAGQTIGCGLAFIVTWTGSDAAVLGSTGNLNVFVAKDGSLTTGIKVAALRNDQSVRVKLAGVEVEGMPSTREFSPTSDVKPPHSIFMEWEDKYGRPRLEAAARIGFELKLTLVGRPDDEIVRIPAASSSTMAELRECLEALKVR